jgi:transketolase
MIKSNKNFRIILAREIYKKMKVNKNIWVLVGDLGYGLWDQVRVDFPDRFINVGAAEQSLIGISVGLALQSKIPITYSISPFLLYRPFETIRNYVNREKIPIKLVGSGRNMDYEVDGASHWATEDRDIMKILKNIKSFWPTNEGQVIKLVDTMISDPNPYYINLKK